MAAVLTIYSFKSFHKTLSLLRILHACTCDKLMRSGLKNTLLQKLFFYIFHSFFSLSSLQRGTPPKVFFGKTVWGRRKEPYIFFKTHPRSNRAAPPSCLCTKDLSEAPAAAIILHPPPPALLLEGNCC